MEDDFDLEYIRENVIITDSKNHEGFKILDFIKNEDGTTDLLVESILTGKHFKFINIYPTSIDGMKPGNNPEIKISFDI